MIRIKKIRAISQLDLQAQFWLHSQLEHVKTQVRAEN